MLFAGTVKHRAWEASLSVCTLSILENLPSRARHIGAAAAVLYCLRRGTKVARQAQRSRCSLGSAASHHDDGASDALGKESKPSALPSTSPGIALAAVADE